MRYHGALCTPDKNHVKKRKIILVMLELGAMLLMIADRRAYIYRGDVGSGSGIPFTDKRDLMFFIKKK